MRRAQIRALVWISDAGFQLAGGIGLLAITCAIPQRQGRLSFPFIVNVFAGAAASLAGLALLAGLLARLAFHQLRPRETLN